MGQMTLTTTGCNNDLSYACLCGGVSHAIHDLVGTRLHTFQMRTISYLCTDNNLAVWSHDNMGWTMMPGCISGIVPTYAT